VIFRRIASKTRKTPTSENTDMFISLSKDHAGFIRTKLLETLLQEGDRMVRNKISDAVAEVGRQYSDNSWSCSLRNSLMLTSNLGDSWPELLQALFTLSQTPDPGKRETAFRVFTTTPGIIEKQHEDAVAQAFASAFKDESVSVCLCLVSCSPVC